MARPALCPEGTLSAPDRLRAVLDVTLQPDCPRHVGRRRPGRAAVRPGPRHGLPIRLADFMRASAGPAPKDTLPAYSFPAPGRPGRWPGCHAPGLSIPGA